MHTKPPGPKLLPPHDVDKIAISRSDANRIIAARRMLERASLFIEMLDASDEKGKWARVRRLAILDAGLRELGEGIAELDRVLPQLPPVGVGE